MFKILQKNMISNSVFCIAALLIVTAVSPIRAQGITIHGQCTTPNGESGSCIDFEQCTPLYKMLRDPATQPHERQFLLRSQCGSKNRQIWICCPDRYIEPQPTPESTEPRMRGLLPEPGKCGHVISNRIYGGNVTKIDEFPWMALIEYQKGNNKVGHHCGGSLINDRYVLTAAHCIKAIPETWTPFRIRLGEWDTSTDRDCDVDIRGNQDCADPHVDIDIEKVITHERYELESKNQLYDIALIRLARSVTSTHFIEPICLPIKDSLRSANFDGTVMDVCGWGKTEFGDSRSNLKLKAEVPVVPLADCQIVYKNRNVILENSQICAGGTRGIDSCRGDSGGPLIALDSSNKERVYYFIAGVVSFGPTPCGLQGWPGVYTKISNYIGWIQNNIEI